MVLIILDKFSLKLPRHPQPIMSSTPTSPPPNPGCVAKPNKSKRYYKSRPYLPFRGKWVTISRPPVPTAQEVVFQCWACGSYFAACEAEMCQDTPGCRCECGICGYPFDSSWTVMWLGRE